MRFILLVSGVALGIPASSDIADAQVANGIATPVVSAVVISENLSIDGRLDEESWRRAIPATEFYQRDPIEGDPVTERTELRVLYNDAALYAGVRLYDREASRIISRLGRRDSQGDADRFTLYLDPYHDHLTGAMFLVSAAGVQYDASISNDTKLDVTWDAVWESAVSHDETGWTLELRIPFSQLRFSSRDVQTWGITPPDSFTGTTKHPGWCWYRKRSSASRPEWAISTVWSMSAPGAASSCCPTSERARSWDRPRRGIRSTMAVRHSFL